VNGSLDAHGAIRADRGVAHWRYECPHCGSIQLDERTQKAKYLTTYTEIPDDVDRYSGLGDDGWLAEVAQYYCASCKTPVEADERIDKKNDD
jgi:DNA-directed RNA polymerase subunit RPC12/RpoP